MSAQIGSQPRNHSRAKAAAAPPTTHWALPVIMAWAAPALLELVLPVLCDAALPVPVVLELFPADELFSTDVFEAVAALFVVEAGVVAELVDPPVPVAVPKSVLGGRESVSVTGMYEISDGSSVVVLIPGKLASSPPKDSVQTPAVVPVRVQSK